MPLPSLAATTVVIGFWPTTRAMGLEGVPAVTGVPFTVICTPASLLVGMTAVLSTPLPTNDV